MVRLLCAEEDKVNPADPGTVVINVSFIHGYIFLKCNFFYKGPCLEFVLRHKILDTLLAAATNDVSFILLMGIVADCITRVTVAILVVEQT